jgi:hypothetical protein
MRSRPLAVRRAGAFAVGVGTAALAACGSILGGGSDVVTLEVAEALVPCMALVPRECMLVRQPGAAEYTFFYDDIEGFNWEPGFRYRLRVERRQVRNPPADGSSLEYRLVRLEQRTASPHAELLARVAAAQTRWESVRPARYEIVQERICFCTVESRGPARIEVVVDGFDEDRAFERPVGVRAVADGSTIAAPAAWHFHSVQALFTLILRAAAADAHRIEAEFDADAGHPLRVRIDPRAGIADDEVEYIVHSVTGT